MSEPLQPFEWHVLSTEPVPNSKWTCVPAPNGDAATAHEQQLQLVTFQGGLVAAQICDAQTGEPSFRPHQAQWLGQAGRPELRVSRRRPVPLDEYRRIVEVKNLGDSTLSTIWPQPRLDVPSDLRDYLAINPAAHRLNIAVSDLLGDVRCTISMVDEPTKTSANIELVMPAEDSYVRLRLKGDGRIGAVRVKNPAILELLEVDLSQELDGAKPTGIRGQDANFIVETCMDAINRPDLVEGGKPLRLDMMTTISGLYAVLGTKRQGAEGLVGTAPAVKG